MKAIETRDFLVDLMSNKLEVHQAEKRWDISMKELTELERIATTTNELEAKLNLIWKEINNAYYLGDMKKRNFFNLIHEVAEIIKPDYEEIGREFIE